MPDGQDPLGILTPPNKSTASKKEVDNGDPLGILKKKDGGTQPSKVSPLGSSNIPAETKPATHSAFDSPLGIDQYNKQDKLTTQDGFDIPVNTSKLPSFVDKSGYLSNLQKKITSGTHTNQDVQEVATLSGKSPEAVQAYIEDKSKGLATERGEQIVQTRNKLAMGLQNYNGIMSTGFKPEDVFSSAQKTTEFLNKVKNQFSPESLKQNEGLRLHSTSYAFIDNLEQYKDMLQEHVVKLTVSEGQANGDSPDTIKKIIAERIDQPEKPDKPLLPIPTPGKMVKDLYNIAFGTKERDDLLNSEKGEADLQYNGALEANAIDKISVALLNPQKDPKTLQMIKEGQEDLAKVDHDAIYKYPSLVQRDIARNVSKEIARESGQLKGSTVESYRGGIEKVIGSDRSDYERVMKNLGYFDNPKTKDAANFLLNNPQLFSDASYLGTAFKSFSDPLKNLGMSFADITGMRGDKDIRANIIKDQYFPTETPGIKESASVVRNMTNTTTNLLGMTAIALGTAGAGTELGLGLKAAERLGAYASFGLPAWDGAYKDAYSFSDNDAVRGLYATMNSLVMAEGGRVFDLGKFGKKIPGVSEDFQNLAKKIGEKEITVDAARELLGGTKDKIADFFMKYGKNVTKGAATMAGFTASENILKFAFGDPNTNGDDIIGRAANSFYNGVLGMSIMGGFGAVADMKNEANTTYKGIIYKAAQNHDALADIFKKGKDAAYISPELYTQKMSILEGAKMAKDMVDLAESQSQIPLTENEKSVYVANKTAAGILKQKLKNVTNENEKETIEGQIGRLEKQSQEIFDGLKFNHVLEPLYDLHNAEKEYTKAKEDLSKGIITDADYEKAKNNFEKLQYNYFEGGMEATAKASEVKRLLNKGIESGKIPDIYKGYAEHPDEFLKFIADQSHGLNDDGTKSPYGGNEETMRKEFGNELVDHAIESHPLPAEVKEPEKEAPIIVRHAEAEEPIVPGEPENKNPQLTDVGKKQAENLGEDFKEKGVTQIIASPVDRSLDTANIAAKESGASVRQDERLAEYRPEEETLDAFANRVNEAMADVHKLGSETAVVTHGKVLAMVEALEKNNGDIEAAKKDFENSKEYGNTEAYKPPSSVSVIQPGEIARPETTTIAPAEKETPVNEESEALRDSAKRFLEEGDKEGHDQLMKRADEIENGIPPPAEPPKINPKASPGSQWTAIRKEKQIEIDAVKEAYEKQGVKAWTETMENALNKLQQAHPESGSLYEAAMNELNLIRSGNSSGIFTPDESVAAMQFLKREIEVRRTGLYDDMSGTNDAKRLSAIALDKVLQDDHRDAALAIKKVGTEAGRTLNYLQSELGYDPDHGLQLRRMDLMRAQGGGELSAADMKWTSEKWEQEKENAKAQQEAREKGMQEAFDKKIEQLTKDYEKKFKEAGKDIPKTKKEKTLSQKGKDIADQIRKLKSDKTTLQADITLGLRDLAVEAVAKLVEVSGTIAEAIGKVLEDVKYKGLSKDELENHIVGGFQRFEDRAAAYTKIKDNVAVSKATGITNDMVAKNFIRDYVNSHIGEFAPKDVLNESFTELQKILPSITKEQLREAYLKEGDFKQPSKKDLETQSSKDRKSLVAITKLEEDIADLQAGLDLKVRGSKGEREKDEHEVKLINEKDKLLSIKDRSEKEQERIVELNAELARINLRKEKEKVEKKPKVKEVSEREQKLLDEIKEAKDKWDEEKKEAAKIENKESKAYADRIKKIADLDAKIRRLKERDELMKNAAKKEPEEIDKTIKFMQDKLQKTLNDKGLKVSGEDKYTKASYNERAKSHNDRLEGLSKKIQGKIDGNDLTEDQKKVLTKLNDRIEGSKIKLSEENALSNKPVVDYGLETIKKVKAEFDRDLSTKDAKDLGEFKRDLQRVIDGFDSDEKKSQQDIKLAQTKEQLKTQIKETGRKLNAGEFEDKPTVELKKSDSALVSLQIQKNLIDSEYNKKKNAYEKENQSKLKRAAELARAAYVTYLIGHVKTLINVASSALIRPTAEAASKIVGKSFNWIPTQTTHAIFEKAKEGGESTSWKSIAKGYQAYFRQFSEKQLEERATKKDAAYEDAAKNYYDQIDKVDAITDKDSKEYKEASAQLKPLKEKMDSNLLDAVGDAAYMFLGGSSLQDFWQTLLHRTSEIEKKFGHIEEESLKKYSGKDKVGTTVDNIEYIANFVGRSHSALKTFSGRYSFAAGFMGRLEAEVAKGEGIKPEKILEIANESYLDWDRGKYQEANPISDSWNKITNLVEKESPALAYLMRFDVAITRVPVNMIREGVMEYTLGSFRAPLMAAREYYKAKGIVLKDGYTAQSGEEFKRALGEQLKEIDPERAAQILRAYRKGGFGLGMYALALTGLVAFGGWNHKGQAADDKKKKKLQDQYKDPQLLTGEIEIGGKKVPEWAQHVIEHAPAAAPLMFATGYYGVYDNAVKSGEIAPEAAKQAVMAQLDHIVNSLPQIEKVVVPVADAAGINPSTMFTKWDAVDKDGNIEKRKIFRMSDYLDVVPVVGNHNNLLTPANFKVATKIQKAYKTKIESIERSHNLTSEEKEKQIKEERAKMKKGIDAIYEANKKYESKHNAEDSTKTED